MPDLNQTQMNEFEQPVDAPDQREQIKVEAPEPLKPSPTPAGQTQQDDPAAALNQLSQVAPQPQPQPSKQQQPQTTPAKVPPGAGSEPYIKAAENVIQRDKNDPYQEEEDHEDIQVQYLHDRFGKDVKKG